MKKKIINPVIEQKRAELLPIAQLAKLIDRRTRIYTASHLELRHVVSLFYHVVINDMLDLQDSIKEIKKNINKLEKCNKKGLEPQVIDEINKLLDYCRAYILMEDMLKMG